MIGLAVEHGDRRQPLLLAASVTDGLVQGGLWALAILLDLGLPFLF